MSSINLNASCLVSNLMNSNLSVFSVTKLPKDLLELTVSFFDTQDRSILYTSTAFLDRWIVSQVSIQEGFELYREIAPSIMQISERLKLESIDPLCYRKKITCDTLQKCLNKCLTLLVPKFRAMPFPTLDVNSKIIKVRQIVLDTALKAIFSGEGERDNSTGKKLVSWLGMLKISPSALSDLDTTLQRIYDERSSFTLTHPSKELLNCREMAVAALTNY